MNLPRKNPIFRRDNSHASGSDVYKRQVSTWMHQYIKEMKEHEFVLWVIGAHAEDKGKFVYELPENVVEVKEVFLDDALHVKDTGKLLHIFTREEQDSLRELMDCGRPDWEVLFRLYHDKKINPMSFLKSEEFLEILEKSCLEKYPYTAFADAFHTMRSMPVSYTHLQWVADALTLIFLLKGGDFFISSNIFHVQNFIPCSPVKKNQLVFGNFQVHTPAASIRNCPFFITVHPDW